ncbi:CaiB/BaiF CoA-transferase family protein [Brevibacterium sp.]|uniref:CaiB/BaiF CoA transferase family protein n=1 Tax=Brevibacterium sp. TaxID=1701 RepID=UPI0025BF5367|nr:CaiB/BaiF CoA-transferase family protein [Brevibacterium sp.]
MSGTDAGADTGAGPLAGIRVVEFAGIGPGPHAAMLLADHGAEVVRIERPAGGPPADAMLRGRRLVRADLKDADDREAVRGLLDAADVLIEGFRPGVMERLGLGPDEVMARCPRLVYGRMTGWGQDGPEARTAGHDLAYIARTGTLSLIGQSPDAAPVPPLNLVGDFGGGSMFLVLGVLAALLERERTGRGQVVDAAIVDGTAALSAMMWARRGSGGFSDVRGRNRLDGSAPFYSVYACSDGRHMAVSAVERPFFDLVTEALGLPGWPEEERLDPARWPAQRAVLAAEFARHPQAHWIEVFDGTDACTAPVRAMPEAAADPQLAARGVLVEADGVVQPRPAPRFSAHGIQEPRPVPHEAEALETLLLEWRA